MLLPVEVQRLPDNTHEIKQNDRSGHGCFGGQSARVPTVSVSREASVRLPRQLVMHPPSEGFCVAG
jgi:hypothetical protein